MDLLTRELHRLRLENAYMSQSKQLSVGGMMLIERVHDVIARAFRDERIYNLLDLRAMVCMACQLAKSEFQNDLTIQDKLYQAMETIITKLQSIAELDEPLIAKNIHSFG